MHQHHTEIVRKILKILNPNAFSDDYKKTWDYVRKVILEEFPKKGFYNQEGWFADWEEHKLLEFLDICIKTYRHMY